MFSSHGGHLTNAMYHHGNTLIKLTLHDETKKRAHDSQKVRAKENLKLSHGGSVCSDDNRKSCILNGERLSCRAHNVYHLMTSDVYKQRKTDAIRLFYLHFFRQTR